MLIKYQDQNLPTTREKQGNPNKSMAPTDPRQIQIIELFGEQVSSHLKQKSDISLI